MFKKYSSISFLFSVVYSSFSLAQVYVGGYLGYGQTGLSKPAIASAFQRSGYTWATSIGYQFDNPFAVEAGYNRMRNVKALGVMDGFYIRDIVEPSFTYLALKGSVGLFENLSFFAKAGGAYTYGKDKLTVLGMTTTNSQSKIVPYLALGLDYKLSNYFYLTGEIASTSKKDTIPRLTTGLIGLRYVSDICP